MTRITPFHLLPALIAAVSHAGEITIEPRPFFVEKSFSTTALPAGDCVLLKLDPTDKFYRRASHSPRLQSC
jgi:hypothetical protein